MYGAGEEDEICWRGDLIRCKMAEGRCKMLLIAIWQFCSFLFVPQWGKHRVHGSLQSKAAEPSEGFMVND